MYYQSYDLGIIESGSKFRVILELLSFHFQKIFGT